MCHTVRRDCIDAAASTAAAAAAAAAAALVAMCRLLRGMLARSLAAIVSAAS